ncbi:peptide ABC transporter permease [Virgibacillus pantothenticus]|uniref:Peptide ABC transporter permease n=1 Tax=Virgibacillus pantothenticus TaxID=1473 RepID=A0A0L0QJZ4_VIRPA|nr:MULTISPECIES: ABC transporter permease [Virgibacillus]API92813.1 peptide ABC transporter permease [Virgibacillus sp. 6R]KNE18950.1 peptide ABC transporter permease [Virgibacillus pantothenticus]MBS7428321.1 ABC transporter permease [Virgibacillus sp. 19R1-5]MBU8565246.1 ABC transporter permease [Virgibacillus pantothenticus]MBU8599535.1 ABC transporter permease [Virgibacillus pantothenticus]
MTAYIIRRLLHLIPVLIGMTLITFSIVHLIPGNPAQTILGEAATQEAVKNLEESMGLNEPYIKQYGIYVTDLLKGDLGTSLRTKAAITKEIWPHIAATFELTFFAMLFAIFIGVNAGIISAWKQNSWFDFLAMLFALVGVSIPVFWLALMEQWVFAQELGWFPAYGRENSRDPIAAITQFYVLDALIHLDFPRVFTILKHLLLPSIALGTIPMAIIARMTRSSMLEVMQSDYIRTVRAKGGGQFLVIYKHALKNATIPVLTVIGLQTGVLLGGAILTETIFSWPGIGRYVFEAINYRDYPVIQSGILVIAFLFVMINLIVDILYTYIDPRIKY